MMDKKGKQFLYLAAVSVNLMSLVGTMGYSWTSPYLPKLMSDDEDNPIGRPTTVLENSWITSLHNVGCIVGPLVAALFADRLGKKRTIILFHTPIMVSNIVLVFAHNVEAFYISRFLLGVGSGCVYSIIPAYIVEICDADSRGSTSMILNLMLSVTSIIVVVLGPYVSISIFSVIFLVPSVLFLLIFGLYIPDSPHEFIMRGKLDKAESSLSKLRQTKDVQKELLNIISSIETAEKDIPLKEIFQSRAVIRSLVITIGLMFFQQFSGWAALTAYQQTIFDSTGSSIPGHIAVMIVNIVQLGPAIVTAYVVDKVGMKKILIYSHIPLILSLGLLGAYFYLQSKDYNLDAVSWLPLTCLLAYMVFFRVGLGPIPPIYMGELFPSDLKAKLSALVTAIMFLFSFFVTFIFPPMFLQFGMGWTFWILTFFVVISGVFCVMYVPETKGRSFLEIQLMLKEGRKK